MQVRNHGKYTRMRKNNPRGIATCDYSGFMVQHAALKDQYEYRGQGLVKTGYLVHPKFLDKPNPQNLTPLIKVDPVPLERPRPDTIVDNPQPQVLTLAVSGSHDEVILTADQWINSTFIVTGILTGEAAIIVPSSFNIFSVLNSTNFPLVVVSESNLSVQGAVFIPPTQTMLLCMDGYTLRVLNQAN